MRRAGTQYVPPTCDTHTKQPPATHVLDLRALQPRRVVARERVARVAVRARELLLVAQQHLPRQLVLLCERLHLGRELLVRRRAAVERHGAARLGLDVGERVGERGVEVGGGVGLDLAQQLLDARDTWGCGCEKGGGVQCERQPAAAVAVAAAAAAFRCFQLLGSRAALSRTARSCQTVIAPAPRRPPAARPRRLPAVAPCYPQTAAASSCLAAKQFCFQAACCQAATPLRSLTRRRLCQLRLQLSGGLAEARLARHVAQLRGVALERRGAAAVLVVRQRHRNVLKAGGREKLCWVPWCLCFGPQGRGERAALASGAPAAACCVHRRLHLPPFRKLCRLPHRALRPTPAAAAVRQPARAPGCRSPRSAPRRTCARPWR